MNEQDLKNSILQLAVQGKLVEQREEEGTARELLEQIRVEKDRLIKEKKIKWEKPLEEISEDEIPFDIPESWQWTNLAELTTINGGFAFKSTNYSEQGVRVIRISDFNEQGFVNNKIVRHTYDDSLERYLLENNDILLCMTGGTVGKSYFVKSINEPMMSNQRVATIKIDHRILPDYINYTILSPVIQSVIRSSKNSTNDNISMNTIKRFTIPLPPLEEQKRIVAKIEELTAYTEKYGEAYCKVEELNKKFPEDMQKSILQYAIQGKLVEQREEEEGTAEGLYKKIQDEKRRLIKEGKVKKTKALPKITEDEIPFDIPENWKWVRLGEMVNFNMGKTPPRSEPKYWKDDYNWVSIADMVSDGYVVETKEKISEIALNEKFKMSLVPKGTLLMSFKLTVGKVSVLDIDAVHNEAIISIYPYADLNKSIRNYLFVMLPLLSTYGETKSAIKGKTLNSTSLNNLLIPLPPLTEQKRIVEKIEVLLPYTKQLIKKID